MALTDENRRTIRTVFQVVLALCAGLPMIVAASGIPATAAGVGVVLAVAGGFSRAMALPLVEDMLATYVPWLAKDAPTSE